MPTQWKVLVVEDMADIAAQIRESADAGGWVAAPESMEVESCENFADALRRVTEIRFDLLILDLKDDREELPDEGELPGVKVFKEFQRHRFVPVIFYTALPNYVADRASAFVKVVEKTGGIVALRAAVHEVFKTHLPALARHIEDQQRKYMWEFVSDNWGDFQKLNERIDLAYLLARHLASFLSGPAIKKFIHQLEGSADESGEVHPLEMYLVPPSNDVPLAGDIRKRREGEQTTYWVILTPSCDFENEKAETVLLAHCRPLVDFPAYIEWLPNKADKSKLGNLKALMGDNPPKAQPDRYKFLPGTFFLPDLVVDFQQTRCVAVTELANYEPVASLDSPYAEALSSKVGRYLGRVGAPNIDRDFVLRRLTQQG